MTRAALGQVPILGRLEIGTTRPVDTDVRTTGSIERVIARVGQAVLRTGWFAGQDLDLVVLIGNQTLHEQAGRVGRLPFDRVGRAATLERLAALGRNGRTQFEIGDLQRVVLKLERKLVPGRYLPGDLVGGEILLALRRHNGADDVDGILLVDALV